LSQAHSGDYFHPSLSGQSSNDLPARDGMI
jgi:hypothetical protein